MSEIITLSSEDEEESVVVRKKIKLTTVSTKVEVKNQEDSCIVVLDDDDDEEDYKEIKMDVKQIPETTNGNTKIEENGNANNTVCENIPTNTKEGVTEKDSLKVEANNEDCENDDTLNNSKLDLENEIESKLFLFLNNCVHSLTDFQHKSLLESKLHIIKKLYQKLRNLNYDSEELNEIIKDNMEKIKKTPREGIVYFNDVFTWLKVNYKQTSEARKNSEHNQKIIKKLEKALLKIRKKIRSLESAEIDFEEEENSSYVQMDRYMLRASQIYAKLCKYRQENPYHGCLLYCRLDFSKSEYSEINQALNKKYKNNKIFPTFYDVDKCIRKCVQENKLKISEENIKIEIKYCFEELGKLMQKRRKLDLYNNQRSYIENTDDPALENSEMRTKLNENRVQGNKKLDEVMEKYTRLQEKGVNPNVSSESEDSNMSESGSENEQNENVTENV